MKTNLYMDLGKRNKGLFWEYASAYSFLNTNMPITKYSIPLFLGYGCGEGNNHCHNLGVIENNKNLMIKEFNEGIYTKFFFEEIDKLYRSKLELVKKICENDFSKYSNEQIIDSFNQVCKYLFQGNKPMLMSLMAQFLNLFFEEHLIKVLKDKNKVSEFTSLLLTPLKLTQVQIEEELLLDFEKNIPEDVSKEEFLKFCEKNIKLLDNLVDKAGWFHMEYMQDPFDVENYKEHIWKRIQNKTKSEYPRDKIKEIKIKQESFFNEHPSEKLKNLSFAMQEFSFILDASKAVIIEMAYRSLSLFNEIGKRIGVSRRDLLQLSLPEIIDLLKSGGKVDKKIIDERWQNRAVLLEGSKISLYQGEKAAELAEKLIEKDIIEKDIIEKDITKGLIGYAGKIKGKVTVISSIKDSYKFKEGDILVSHDVTAELTSILKKAAAIVTDQGGIICHAAIVAREFKTPCIVGTKTATKVFKDGDLVEVDAEKGIVKKLN